MSVLDKSLSAAVLIIAVVVIRSLALNKLPKRTFLVLWGVVICHLLFPVSIASPFSLYTGIDLLEQAFLKSNGFNRAAASANTDLSHGTEQGIAIGEPGASLSLVTVFWLLGMCACVLFFAVGYIKNRREFQTSLPVEKECCTRWLSEHPTSRSVQIRQCDLIQTPLTYGVFRPVVLLPSITDWTDETKLQYILTHEFVHIRRCDALTKLILAFVVSVHWFNPLVWVMYVLVNRDIEISCDEAVVKSFGVSHKSAYAMTLINMEESKSRLGALYSSFSKNSIEERIVSIMKIKKTSSMGVAIALTLMIAVPVVFATDTVGVSNPEQTSSEQVAVTLTKDEGGSSMVSTDGGETWMNEVEFQKLYPVHEIEWWTYDGYKAWLEQEKVALQSLVNAPGWSQKRVDDAIKLYEETLELIKKGSKFSKLVEGDDNVGYAEGSLYPVDSAGIETESAATATMYSNPESTGTTAAADSIDPAVSYSWVVNLENGDTKEFVYATKQELNAAVEAFCDEQIKAGRMERQEVENIMEELQPM
ncbi:M56 family metallopeptidase [Paenibacillus donghaensis]|nr:M56 family metallopeptidase [Paenibacillus donghaensis]